MEEQAILAYLTLSDNLTEDALQHSPISLSDSWLTDSFDLRLQFLQENNHLDESRLDLFLDQVSPKLNAAAIKKSLLIQPLVWLRALPKDAKGLEMALQKANVDYQREESLFSLENGNILNDGKFKNWKFEIQDKSSQETIRVVAPMLNDKLKVWDCCCGAGGKSLALMAINHQINLHVSDSRQNIMESFHARLKRYGYAYSSATINVKSIGETLTLMNRSGTPSHIKPGFFDLVVADVPCSGSGTWARNPEHILQSINLENYIELQKSILHSIVPFVKKGGHVLYITCSIFGAENEELINHFTQEEPSFNIAASAYIDGCEERADTLFYTLLVKN